MDDERGGAGRDTSRAADAPQDPLTVEFHLTPEEWVDVAMEHNRQSEYVRRSVRQGQRSLGLLVLLLGVLGFVAGYGSSVLLWLFAGAVGVALFPKLSERSQRKHYESFAKSGIANGMFGAHRIHLRDDGLLDETEAYERLTRWHAIDRVEEGPGAFMIYLGRDAFLPIPHSAFRDPETLRAFGERFFQRLTKGRELGEGTEF